MHPLWQQRELVEFIRDADIHLVAYAPLARGEALKIDVIREIAEERGDTPAQVVLAWLTDQRNVVAVAKSTDARHLEENLRAPFATLSAEDVSRSGLIDREKQLIDPLRYEKDAD